MPRIGGFALHLPSNSTRCRLRFEGLATLAEVWLNGQHLLSTDNMFRKYEIDVAPHLRAQNALVLGFRSVAADLKKKRSRPRWKTNVVNHQQLRWLRTSLLGRIPGWSPPVPCIGPWRTVRIDTLPLAVADWHLTTRLSGENGVVALRGRLASALPILDCQLHVGSHQVALALRKDGDNWLIDGELPILKPALWWPHTHGEQPLLPCTLEVATVEGTYTIDCGKVGFRQLEVRHDNGFEIVVNGEPIYCRGACWTVSDIVRPGSEAGLARELRLARDAGDQHAPRGRHDGLRIRSLL